jgi:hypothetical protein
MRLSVVGVGNLRLFCGLSLLVSKGIKVQEYSRASEREKFEVDKARDGAA